MSTSAALALPFARHEAISIPLPAVPQADRQSDKVWEHLVVLAPLCLVPLVKTPADIFSLTFLFALLIGTDAALASFSSAWRAARQWPSAALLGAGLWLTMAPVLGTGAMVTFGLFVVVRCVDRQVPLAAWTARLGLAALATALVVDLSLVTLALERSIVWLALGAAIGTAFAANRMLEVRDAPSRAFVPEAGEADAATDRQRMLLQAVLVTALILVLALYGALLAHEPALVIRAVAGGFLTVPLLALAVLRLAHLALLPARPAGVDPVAAGLLASWALVAWSLFSQV